MKLQSAIKQLRLFFKGVAICLTALISENSTAQVSFSQDKDFILKKDNVDGFDEKNLREKMKMDGLSDKVIDILIEQRRGLWKKGKGVEWTTMYRKNDPSLPIPMAPCSDMGGESGWGSWSGAAGTAGPTSFGGSTNPPPASNGSTCFNITSGGGNDACTPGPNPGDPPIPVVAPGFGNSSIMLGCPQTPNCYAEQITYPFTVTAQDTNFVYSYALVIEDPGHDPANQPFVGLCIYDSAGNPVPCGCFTYTAGNLPGFYQASCFGAYYKPWTLVGVNLSAYIGQTLNIVITNVDCGYCGHYAQSYWDFSCSTLSGTAAAYCPGQSTSLCAPNDPQITYSYQWYQNGSIYTGPPNSTSMCITPTPVAGDTFVVEVQQPSGCNFSLVYAPQPMSVTPNFTFSGLCGNFSFTDASTTSTGVPIVSWSWTFPGGSPSTSTSQNPTVTFPAGTYSVTLIVVAQNGCTDTITLPVNVTGLPQAAFASTTVCQGFTTQLTDNSVPGAGDPIVLWNWTLPGGTPASSTAQNPVVTYPAGTYTATLLVTSQQGCTSTVSLPIVINPLPVANLSGPNVCFNNATQFADASIGNNTITNWSWNFGNGNTSTLQNPAPTYGNPGTYTVTLIVTNNFGCLDTNSIVVVVDPLPVANFVSNMVCFGDSTCFNDQSTITTGTITGWSWNFDDPNSASNISNAQNPCHTFTGLGPYNVVLTVTSDSGCQSTTILPASVYGLPVAAFSTQNVCLNVIANFIDGSTPPAGDQITVWNWNFGDPPPGTSTVQSPSYLYSAPGTYTTTLIVTTNNGCKDTITNPIQIYNLPVANFSNPDSGCAPQCFAFNDLSTSIDGTITNWLWSFPGGAPGTSNNQNPNCINYITPGTYDVSIIVMTQYGCRDTLLIQQYIDIFAWPTSDFSIAPAVASVNEPNFSFSDLWTSDVTQWVWDFGDGSPTDNINTDPSHSYSATATNNDYYEYNVCLYVENIHGCWDSVCKPLELQPEFTFYIPNCVTPTDDNVNELFFGKGRGIKEYTIWVFDRWGNLIWDCHFQGKNTDWDNLGQDGMPSACKWDSKVEAGKGDLVQEDVYVWKVRLTDIFDKKHNYIGHVSVVK